MKTALIPVAAKFLDDEVIYPYYRLQEAGFKVEVYCKQPSQWKYGMCCYGKYGVPIPVTQIDISPYNLNLPAIDLILIPGGVESTEVLRQDKELIELIQEMDTKNRLIAAYCHGPQVLISAGVTKNRHMTCYKGMRIDLRNSGADVAAEEARVAIDDNFVTAQHYKDNPAFMKAVVETYRLREEVIH